MATSVVVPTASARRVAGGGRAWGWPVSPGGRWMRYAVRVVALLAGLIAWQVTTSEGVHWIINFQNLPTPVEVGRHLRTLLVSAHFYVNILYSAERVGLSFVVAVIAGVPLGLAMGRSTLIFDVVSPYIEVLRPIPAVAWIPMSIIMWPTNESSIMFITFLGAFFPIVVNSVQGAASVPPLLIRAAETLGAGRRAILWHVVFPSALPSVMAGLSVGMGISWFSVLTAEMISGRHGIGSFTWKAYQLIQYPDIVIGMLTIGLLGTGSTALVRALSRPLLAWTRQHER